MTENAVTESSSESEAAPAAVAAPTPAVRRRPLKRATKITMAAQLPLSGERVLITTDAFEARALQHEIDHTNGLLFLDRVTRAPALHSRKVYLGSGDGS